MYTGMPSGPVIEQLKVAHLSTGDWWLTGYSTYSNGTRSLFVASSRNNGSVWSNPVLVMSSTAVYNYFIIHFVPVEAWGGFLMIVAEQTNTTHMVVNAYAIQVSAVDPTVTDLGRPFPAWFLFSEQSFSFACGGPEGQDCLLCHANTQSTGDQNPCYIFYLGLGPMSITVTANVITITSIGFDMAAFLEVRHAYFRRYG